MMLAPFIWITGLNKSCEIWMRRITTDFVIRSTHSRSKIRYNTDEVREGYEEHMQIKSLLAQIASITPADKTSGISNKAAEV
jgi:hypothetical protein